MSTSEDEVLRSLQQQIQSLQDARQAQLQRDQAKAEAEAKLRQQAGEIANGLVELNVGGVRYTSSLTTLTAVPDSYFSAYFGGNWQQLLTSDGAVFLDRDGEVC